jgi:hypothetical protein
MKKVTNQILAFLLLVVLAGCSPSDEGGGGGGSTAKSYSLAEGGSVRNLTAGDYFKYTGTSELQQGYSTKVPATSVYEQSISSGGYTLYSSNPIIISASTLVLTDLSGAIVQSTSADYYVNSGGIDYHMMEQGNDDLFYAVNQLNGIANTPVKIITDGSYSQAYTYDACSSYLSYTCVSPTTVASVTATYTLIGTETVSTSIGNFESYKIKMTITQTSINTNAFSNYDGTSTVWYHPSLGMVKQTVIQTLKDYSPQIISTAEITLNATNNSKYSRNQSGLGLWSPLSIFKMMKPIQ